MAEEAIQRRFFEDEKLIRRVRHTKNGPSNSNNLLFFAFFFVLLTKRMKIKGKKRSIFKCAKTAWLQNRRKLVGHVFATM